MPRKTSSGNGKSVEALTHPEAKRKNIPTAEHRAVMEKEAKPITVRYPRNTDLDPQLVWRGKDSQDWSDLVVHAPPLYIQEKVHPKALIDDLLKTTNEARHDSGGLTPDLFADFNGIPKGVDKTEFYRHDQNWTNRMILGDSLQVMASLAEREGLRGKVQCIYFDPPYGIKFNSNFQWSTTSRDVKDGNVLQITREPEQVKAFRDTWRDGVHSYLSYLRDRLAVARDLLSESGAIFVQIGDENVHRVRSVLDEIFGSDNFCGEIVFRKTTGKGSDIVDSTVDFLLFYARSRDSLKFRPIYEPRSPMDEVNLRFMEVEVGVRRPMTRDEFLGRAQHPRGARIYRPNPLTSARVAQGQDVRHYCFQGRVFSPGGGTFKTNMRGLDQLLKSDRLIAIGRSLNFIRYLEDFAVRSINDVWDDTRTGGFGEDRLYVVQTISKVISRCLLMTTDPGDLVLDPTCGSGTTAYAAEQWGRRWITVDTSRVALALARARIMGARYPYYLLADSKEGQVKEAEVTRAAPSTQPTHGDIRHGFVYERVPHITLKSIANNAEIDVIHEKWQPHVAGALEALNTALKGHKTAFTVPAGGREGKQVKFDAAANATVQLPSGETAKASELLEWEVPREAPQDWPKAAHKPLAAFWEARIARQREIDASIAAKAEFEYLYDKPYEDKKKVRVAGPFTVESLSPHRMLGVDENGELLDPLKAAEAHVDYTQARSFEQMILDNLRMAGVQQAHKQDKIEFTSLTAWPGKLVCGEGKYREGDKERRAAIFIGPEFGTVTRPDLAEAALEAGESNFDVLIACAFNYEAHASEFEKLGRIPVLKARMNADLHMAEDLKSTGKGNLFVIFGEPDIEILPPEADGRIRVQVRGVDVFDPSTGEVRSDSTDGIACWFIDTDYNGESFFVRHAYFLGQNDPYGALRTTLKAEIDADAWATLNSDVSRPFEKPKSQRIAVKVINHLGDEVMKVFRA